MKKGACHMILQWKNLVGNNHNKVRQNKQSNMHYEPTRKKICSLKIKVLRGDGVVGTESRKRLDTRRLIRNSEKMSSKVLVHL